MEIVGHQVQDHRDTCSFCSRRRILYPGPRCRDCCDDEVLFLYTVAEIEDRGLDPVRELTVRASPGAADLREVAMELLCRLQDRARAAGKLVLLDSLATKIIDSRSCNLKIDTTARRPHTQDAGKDRRGRTTSVTCAECGRATKMRLTTGAINRHQNDRQEWCVAASREISVPRTDLDAYLPPPAPRPAVDGRIVRVDPAPQTAPTIPPPMGLRLWNWRRIG